MTRKGLLNVFNYGLLEFSLLSFFILIGAVIYPIFVAIIITFELTLTIWQFFYREKAKAYLIVTSIRVLLILIVQIVGQIGFLIKEPDESMNWIIGSICIAIFSITFYFIKENGQWKKTLEIWQKIRKLDLEKYRFNISIPNYRMNKCLPDTDNIMHKKISTKVIFSVVAILIFLSFFFNEDFLIRIGFIFFVYVFGMAEGKFISWAFNFIKMEREMKVEFATEYADKKELDRLSRVKIF
jgi:hypothetical protein